MECVTWQVGGVLLVTFIQVGGVAERDLRTLVDFMYHGQLEVSHSVLPHLQGSIEIGRHKDRNAEVGNTKHRIYRN